MKASDILHIIAGFLAALIGFFVSELYMFIILGLFIAYEVLEFLLIMDDIHEDICEFLIGFLLGSFVLLLGTWLGLR